MKLTDANPSITESLERVYGTHIHYFEIDRKVNDKWVSVCRYCGVVVENWVNQMQTTSNEYLGYVMFV